MNKKKNKEVKSEKKSEKDSILVKYVRPILDGSFISRENVEKNFPFFFYLILLIILFITNTFKAQDVQRQINKTKAEVTALRIKSIYMKSQLMESTTPSKMSKLVKDLGLKESNVPPQKIIIEE
jgi:cell division protein FtsL